MLITDLRGQKGRWTLYNKELLATLLFVSKIKSNRVSEVEKGRVKISDVLTSTESEWAEMAINPDLENRIERGKTGVRGHYASRNALSLPHRAHGEEDRGRQRGILFFLSSASKKVGFTLGRECFSGCVCQDLQWYLMSVNTPPGHFPSHSWNLNSVITCLMIALSPRPVIFFFFLAHLLFCFSCLSLKHCTPWD